ncbi:unnamed protein product [Brachionus calyciflorus]|uniref:Ankyrin repeat protein n=1 Tax=Brachionus calyciflorus TaxID=104777 RepID=A0A814NI37_9BILA|nr:unnamed protein product [Brachionus calyciflorus]
MNNLNINQVVESGNFDLFKLMIDLDINLIDSTDDIYGRSPLTICCKYKKSESHVKIAEYLLDSGCDVNIPANSKWNNWTALITACYYGNQRLVELILNSKTNLDIEDNQVQTACQIGIEQSNSDCVNLILNELENKKKYELSKKIEKNNLSLKQFMNSTTTGSHTLLFRACRNSNSDVVKILLDSNSIAKPHYYTKYSPLYIACHMGNEEIAKLLLE